MQRSRSVSRRRLAPISPLARPLRRRRWQATQHKSHKGITRRIQYTPLFFIGKCPHVLEHNDDSVKSAFCPASGLAHPASLGLLRRNLGKDGAGARLIFPVRLAPARQHGVFERWHTGGKAQCEIHQHRCQQAEQAPGGYASSAPIQGRRTRTNIRKDNWDGARCPRSRYRRFCLYSRDWRGSGASACRPMFPRAMARIASTRPTASHTRNAWFRQTSGI